MARQEEAQTRSPNSRRRFCGASCRRRHRLLRDPRDHRPQPLRARGNPPHRPGAAQRLLQRGGPGLGAASGRFAALRRARAASVGGFLVRLEERVHPPKRPTGFQCGSPDGAAGEQPGSGAAGGSGGARRIPPSAALRDRPLERSGPPGPWQRPDGPTGKEHAMPAAAPEPRRRSAGPRHPRPTAPHLRLPHDEESGSRTGAGPSTRCRTFPCGGRRAAAALLPAAPSTST